VCVYVSVSVCVSVCWRRNELLQTCEGSVTSSDGDLRYKYAYEKEWEYNIKMDLK
jgi:hypothetical protein